MDNMVKNESINIVDIQYQDVICDNCNYSMKRSQPFEGPYKYFCPICGKIEYHRPKENHYLGYPKIVFYFSNEKILEFEV